MTYCKITSWVFVTATIILFAISVVIVNNNMHANVYYIMTTDGNELTEDIAISISAEALTRQGVLVTRLMPIATFEPNTARVLWYRGKEPSNIEYNVEITKNGTNLICEIKKIAP